MERLPMYPMLTKENRILALEPVDFLLLLIVYLFVFLCSKNLVLNGAIILAGYLFLASYKRRKAPRYTQSLIRFLMMPPRYTQGWEES